MGSNFIAKRNRFLCLALALIAGIAAAVGVYIFGGAFVWGASHTLPFPLFMAAYGVFLIFLPVVLVVAAYLTYRKTREVVGTTELTAFDSDENQGLKQPPTA